MLLSSSSDKTATRYSQNSHYEPDPTEFTDANPTRQFLAREKTISKRVGMSFFQNNFSKNSISSQLVHSASGPNGAAASLSRNGGHGSMHYQQSTHDAEAASDASQSPRVSPAGSDLANSYLFGNASNHKSTLNKRMSVLSTGNSQLDNDTIQNDDKHADDTSFENDQISMDDAKQETLLNTLSEYSDGFPILLRETKKTILSTKEAVSVFKKRAEAEEQFAKNMYRITQLTLKTEGKNGSFGNMWQQYGKIHEKIGASRAKYAEGLNSLVEEMLLVQKDTERSRKNLKEGHARRWKEVQDADNTLDKSRQKHESTNDEWEKTAAAEHANGIMGNNQKRYGFTRPASNPLLIFKAGIEKNFKRTEEDFKAKANAAKENYKIQVQITNSVRKEFYNTYLPQFVRNLKQTLDEADDRLSQFIVRYSELTMEQKMDEDAIMNPTKATEGLSHITESIDTRLDHEEMIKELTKTKPIDKSDREYIPIKSAISHSLTENSNESTSTSTSLVTAEANTMRTLPTSHSTHSSSGNCFGIPLNQLMQNDTSADPVPIPVVRSIEYIESFGMNLPGLYRVSGSTNQVQKLKQALDKDPASARLDQLVDDIHALTGTLKLFFRELPEPLLPRHMYYQLIDASKIDDDRMRLIQTHELINTLDDVHYATLKCLAGHLWKVQSHSAANKMTIGNLGIVWGPTLMDSPEPTADATDLKYQSRVIETIVGNYDHIFDTE
ncbi:Rho GTPase-activating protein [Batrachochytrium dendrobatidis]|nr:Rho GTPase-activating protein [Batrachochytrium dendrobatidis]